MTKSITPKNTIVYIDDDMDDLELVQEAFEKYSENVEVITFSNSIQAVSFLEAQHSQDFSPCLIIVDLNMPFLNGKEVLMRIRQMEHFKSTPVVVFTTSSLPQDEKIAIQHNAGFITKPIDIKQMQMITDRFIDHCAEEIRKKIRRKAL